jgi:hypothetical protein
MINKGNVRVAAAAGILVLAGLGLGAPTIAHPHGDEDGADTKVEKVIILREGEGGEHRGKSERVRTFHIERDGKHGDGNVRTIRIERSGEHGDGKRVRAFHMGDGARMIDCGGERTEIDEATPGENARERTKIVFCGKDGLSAAQRIEKLEKALDRINANDELSAEHKDKVTAALRGAIERLRTTP